MEGNLLRWDLHNNWEKQITADLIFLPDFLRCVRNNAIVLWAANDMPLEYFVAHKGYQKFTGLNESKTFFSSL